MSADPLDMRIVKVLDTFSFQSHTYYFDYCKSGDFTISQDDFIIFCNPSEKIAYKKWKSMRPKRCSSFIRLKSPAPKFKPLRMKRTKSPGKKMIRTKISKPIKRTKLRRTKIRRTK